MKLRHLHQVIQLQGILKNTTKVKEIQQTKRPPALLQSMRDYIILYKFKNKIDMNDRDNIVGEKNLRIRFDKCVKCIKYENSPWEDKQEKEKHVTYKEETNSRFQTHQDLRKHDSSVLCTTFDLLKILYTFLRISIRLHSMRLLQQKDCYI